MTVLFMILFFGISAISIAAMGYFAGLLVRNFLGKDV